MLLNTWQLVNTWEIPEVVVEVERTGGGQPHRKRRISREISFEGFSTELEFKIPPIEVIESAEGVQKEVERFELAEQLAEARILAAEQEIILLEVKKELEGLIRAEILKRDLIALRKFLEGLILELVELRNRKRRREDEELLFGIVMMGIDEINVTIH